MKRRHTWTIAIATVALAAAAGAALARPGTSTSTAPITAAQAKKIAKAVADTEITRLAPTLAVKSAQSAASANAPALYAHVTATGAVTSSSPGITDANITHPRAGFYCFTGLPAAPKGGIAILDTHDAGVDLIQLGVDGFAAFCPPGTQALVATFHPGGLFVDDPFFVVFWSPQNRAEAPTVLARPRSTPPGRSGRRQPRSSTAPPTCSRTPSTPRSARSARPAREAGITDKSKGV